MYLVSSLCPRLLASVLVMPPSWAGGLFQDPCTRLVEEDILAITSRSVSRMLFQISICADPVLLAQLLPELTAN